MRIIFVLMFGAFGLFSDAQLQTGSFRLYASAVSDSFEIVISRVGKEQPPAALSTVYYLDANIKSGHKLRELLADRAYAAQVQNVLFIGIGYKGDNIARRRRDLIPPLFASSSIKDQPDYGHADRFYQFLTQELIPLIDNRYHTNGRRTLIGHSFGGLFVFYALFQPLQPFRHFIALSPSLWVNRSDIFQYEQAFHQNTRSINGSLYLSAGTRETLNHVLRTTRQMKQVLARSNYSGLQLTYREHSGKDHHTQVAVSLDEVLKTVVF